MPDLKPVMMICRQGQFPIGQASSQNAVMMVFIHHCGHAVGMPRGRRDAIHQYSNCMEKLVSVFLMTQGQDPDTWDLTKRNLVEHDDRWVVDLTISP